ncbi:MAG: hypothetical protein V1494_02960 [Candidatus Diapherotrites archaeon]
MAKKTAGLLAFFLLFIALTGLAAADSFRSISVTGFPSGKSNTINLNDSSATVTAELSGSFSCVFEIFDSAGNLEITVDSIELPPTSTCTALITQAEIAFMERGVHRIVANGPSGIRGQAYFSVYELKVPSIPEMPPAFALLVAACVFALVLRARKPQ